MTEKRVKTYISDEKANEMSKALQEMKDVPVIDWFLGKDPDGRYFIDSSVEDIPTKQDTK